MIDVIFVPLDGSEFSCRAVPVALRFADLLDATLHFLSVVTDKAAVMDRSVVLDKVAVPFERVDRSVIVGSDAADAIVREVQRFKDSVLCMASHGRGRSAAIIGSVATRVVALGLDPILVGPRAAPDRIAAGVVACIDETPESAALVPVALQWAELLHTNAIALAVAEPVPPPLTAGPPRRRFGPDDDVEAFLAHVVAPWRAKGYEVGTRVVYNPISPVDGVETYLSERPTALVVVGSRATAGLKRVVFGSTAADIVNRSPSPVLVVPRSRLHAAAA